MGDCELVHVARNRSMRRAVVKTALKLVGNFLITGKAVNLCRGILLLGVIYHDVFNSRMITMQIAH